jgi:hypothetical protein
VKVNGSFTNTVAKIRPCSRCGRLVLDALDEGMRAVADREPLRSELPALAANLRTYSYTPGGMLVERTPERILSTRILGSLHAQHVCQHNPRVSVAA